MMESVSVYRVQDARGRGPWKPGMSARWVSEEAVRPFADIESMLRAIRRAGDDEHVGCGCRTLEDLRRWFTPGEYDRLRLLGYQCVRLHGCRVLQERESEVVIGRRRQFRKGAVRVRLYEEVGSDG